MQPNKIFTKFKALVKQVVTMSAAGAAQYLSVRGNDAYDPDFALGGLEAYQWTSLAPLWENWYCYKSKCRVVIIPDDTQAWYNAKPISGAVMLYASENQQDFSPSNDTLGSWWGGRNRKIKFYTGNADNTKLWPINISLTCKTRNILSKEAFSLPSLTHQYNSNPSQNWYYTVYSETKTADATTTANLQFYFFVTYYYVGTERKNTW